MIRLPKPRSFWDYALFALIMAGVLMFLFWWEASDRVGWTDAAFAFAAAVLLVCTVVLVRRGEKATWIAQPTWFAYLLVSLGASGWLLAASFADACLLHRRDITSSRLGNDVVRVALFTPLTLWTLLRRRPVSAPD